MSKRPGVFIKGWTWALIIAVIGTAAFGLGIIAGISIAIKPLFGG